MGNFKGTAGPWNCDLPSNYTYGFHIQTDRATKDSYIGEVGGGHQSVEEIRANAQLIAAAPDLLDALQIILGQIERYPKPLTDNEKITIAQQAIIKATTI